MKIFKVNKDLWGNILMSDFTLEEKHIENKVSAFSHGEWVFLKDPLGNQFLGAVNPYGKDNRPMIEVICPQILWQGDIESTIKHLLQRAISRRSFYFSQEEGKRITYGNQDFLPGLVVDLYEDVLIFDIQSFALDLHFEFLFKELKQCFPTKEVIFYPRQNTRDKIGLPQRPKGDLPKIVNIKENGLHFQVNSNVFQKLGYYYDHRENRQRLINWVKRLGPSFQNEEGLDLFCYLGSWGLHLLSAGIKNVDFVDQGDLESLIKKNLDLNGFTGKGKFIRGDVFQYLDELVEKEKKYKVIISDPPAFSKSYTTKNNALSGYNKLHRKIFKLLKSDAILFIGSCTHYVDLIELDRTVREAAKNEKRFLQLFDLGAQSPDHPCSSLQSKSSYLKGLFYLVE